MNDDFGPTLEGLQIPEAIILPPEVIHLLPWMTLAELKITIAAVGRLMSVGGNEPITLSEFEQLTGMDRKTVLVGIERSMQRGVLTRFEVTGYQGHISHVYELRVFIGGKIPPMKPVKAKLSKAVLADTDNDSTTSLAADQNSKELYERLRKIGVYPKPASALIANHTVERIQAFLNIYPTAFQVGRAQGPGWLVKAITDPTWDPDVEAEDLAERKARLSQSAEAKPSKKRRNATLPKNILDDLQKISWIGDTAEVLDAYNRDKGFVIEWLTWAKNQTNEYTAARFRSGLRSGVQAPKDNLNEPDDRRRYVKGAFGDYVNH